MRTTILACTSGQLHLVRALLVAIAFLYGTAPSLAADVVVTRLNPVIPDFRGFWAHGPLDELEPLPWQPAPTRHLRGAIDRADIHVLFTGDHTNPNLRPAAAAVVKRIAEETAAMDARGEIVITNNPQESCRPSGTPNVLLLPGPMQILQEPNQVTILHQRDRQVRRVYLNAEHPGNPRPQPYGYSVGYYDGDTLVVDTIGLTDDTPLDLYGTPHSKELRVIERYRLIENGRRLEVMIRLDDPLTFYHPFDTRMIFTRSDQQVFVEEVCAENNRLPAGTQYSIPTARPDEPRY